MPSLSPFTAMKNHCQNPRRRILISGGLTVGGTQTHLTLLCKVLRSACADVTIAGAATNWPRGDITALRATGVRIVVSPFGFGHLKALGKICAFLTWPFLLRRDYDVLYCIGTGKMHLWSCRFIRKGAKTIYHEIVECPKLNSVAALVSSQMTHLIGNSRRVSREMTKLWPNKKIETIPFLTSASTFATPKPKACPQGHELRITFLGRIVAHKRPDKLIENWSNLSALPGFCPARLDIYGGDYESPYINALRSRVHELGLHDRVFLHGRYDSDQLPRILGNTDLVVLPSIIEGLPLVLVEAMLRGIPIVATSAGGCEELGENNPDVIISNGTSWEAFVAGLSRMILLIRSQRIDSARLHAWTEERYGYESVSHAWMKALTMEETMVKPRTSNL